MYMSWNRYAKRYANRYAAVCKLHTVSSAYGAISCFWLRFGRFVVLVVLVCSGWYFGVEIKKSPDTAGLGPTIKSVVRRDHR